MSEAEELERLVAMSGAAESGFKAAAESSRELNKSLEELGKTISSIGPALGSFGSNMGNVSFGAGAGGVVGTTGAPQANAGYPGGRPHFSGSFTAPANVSHSMILGSNGAAPVAASGGAFTPASTSAVTAVTGGAEPPGTNLINAGQTIRGVGGIIGGAFGLMPGARAGIERHQMGINISAAYGNMGNSQSYRDLERQTMGFRNPGGNFDMQVAAFSASQMMGSESERANMADVAGWGYLQGMDPGQAMQQAASMYSPDTANQMYAYMGISVTNPDGSYKRTDELAKEVYATQVRGNSIYYGKNGREKLMQHIRSGVINTKMFGEAAPMVEKMLLQMAEAERSGKDWSTSIDSEYAEAAGLNDSPTAAQGRLNEAQTAYDDAGADDAARGFEDMNKMLANTTDALRELYEQAKPLSQLFQYLNGGAVGWNNSALGQAVGTFASGVGGVIGGVGGALLATKMLGGGGFGALKGAGGTAASGAGGAASSTAGALRAVGAAGRVLGPVGAVAGAIISTKELVEDVQEKGVSGGLAQNLDDTSENGAARTLWRWVKSAFGGGDETGSGGGTGGTTRIIQSKAGFGVTASPQSPWGQGGLDRARTVLPGLAGATNASSSAGSAGPYPGNTGGAEQWRSVVEKVLRDLGLPLSYVDGVLGQLNSESGGNPNAVNSNDSNWRKGIASFGLMQTIASTYQKYAPPGKAGSITKKNVNGIDQQFVPEMVDPYNSIYAGVNYAKSRYGLGKLDEWASGKHGAYSHGAWRITENETAELHEGEMVIPASIARSFRQAMAESQSGVTSRGEMPDRMVLEVNVMGATEEEGRRLARIVRDELSSISREQSLVSR